MYRILILDDEEHIVNALKRSLRRIDEWEIETFTTGEEALACASKSNFDLFLSDFRMPKMNGVEFLTAVKQIQPNSVRLILSGYTDLEALVGAINEAEIFRFINKPWNDYELILTLEQSLKYKDMMAENLYLANQVREQRTQLSKNELIFEKLENDSPGITKVNWADDGSISLDED